MAKLLLINAKSQSSRDNREIGDIVDIYPDDYAFSNRELAQFDVVTVPGKAADIITASTPPISKMYRLTTTEWTMALPEEKDVRQDTDGIWKDISIKPRFVLQYKDSAVTECFSRFPENAAFAASDNYTLMEQ